jgi:TonB-linked SusC/RagA family outer membrane protein
MDGKYTIPNLPLGEGKFVISYVGFSPREVVIDIKAGENVQPSIVLKEDKMLLNEVVVVGYGTQVKHDISSSIASVKSEDIKDKPVYNFTSALQGKAAGVQITTDNGVAGASTTVRIRGTKSLSNSAEPLYVIDGVPVISYDVSDAGNRVSYNTSPLASINPADIENIEILKDASATAIYGARGSNGVVLVTTKSGKEGKTKIDFSYNAGITQPANKISLLNGDQYRKLYREAYDNDVKDSLTSKPFTYPNQNLLSTKDANVNTDWLDKMFRTGYFNDANISASGGNGKTAFFVAMGIRDEKGFLVNNDFTRASFRGNVTHKASKYFDFGVNTSLTYTTNKFVNTGGSGGLGAAQSSMLPIYPVYDSTGNYFLSNQNPLAQVTLKQQNNVTWRTIDNIFANINLFKFLTFRNEFGIDMINQLENFYYPRSITLDVADAADRRDFYFTWNYTGSLDFKKEFKQDHFFEALVGFNATATIEKFSYIEGKGFPSDNFTEPQQATTLVSATAGTGRQFNFASFFGRLNYKLKNRYLFQVSMRADGSSRFAPSNRWGYFPAGSVAWVVSDEPFFKSQHVMSFLKLRASAGLTGNAEFTNDFAYFSAFSAGQNYAGYGGIAPTSTSVKDLRWESTLKTGVGVDFGFFDGRLSGLIDYYYEKTFDLLVQQAPLTPSSGYSSVTRNQGSLENQGLELQLTSYNFKPTSKFQWRTTLNFGFNRNKVTDLGGVPEVQGTNYGDNRAIVGQPVGVWYLAEYAGVDKNTGLMMIYDDKGNKIVADANSTVKYRKAVGRPYPLFYGGLQNSLSYKGIELDVMLTYSYGQSIYDDAGKRQVGNMGYGFNQYTETLNRWQKIGDVTDVPKLSLTRNYDINTTRNLHDGSYLRLKTVTLAYNLPQSALTKMKMRMFRIFISGQNLAIATAYKGWDPETNREKSGPITQGVTYLSTPQARAFTVGFNFGF